jgi:hypothetical protein
MLQTSFLLCITVIWGALDPLIGKAAGRDAYLNPDYPVIEGMPVQDPRIVPAIPTRADYRAIEEVPVRDPRIVPAVPKRADHRVVEEVPVQGPRVVMAVPENAVDPLLIDPRVLAERETRPEKRDNMISRDSFSTKPVPDSVRQKLLKKLENGESPVDFTTRPVDPPTAVIFPRSALLYSP